MTVLTAGCVCVVSQSTIDDNELIESSPPEQLELQLAQLQQQHQQLTQVLRDILDRQQQQLNKMNELLAMLTNRSAAVPSTTANAGKRLKVYRSHDDKDYDKLCVWSKLYTPEINRTHSAHTV